MSTKQIVRIDSAGLSLVEVLFGFAILAMVLSISTSGLGFLSKRVAKGRMRQIVRGLIQQKLVELEAEPINEGSTTGKFGNDFPAFEYRQTIEPATYLEKPIQGAYKLRLQVEWQSHGQKERLEAQTYLTDFSKLKAKKP